MKNLLLLITIFSILFFSCNRQKDQDFSNTVNPVIGNISYVEKYGTMPGQSADEKLRIATHLEYVEQLLRQQNISHLPLHLKKKRAQMLDLLHQYRIAGNFPKNHDYPDQRKPCFIDKEGNICAVGYLVEQTAGRNFAEKINSLFQYDRIYDMDLPELANWVKNSGFTLREIAMIQPAYGGRQELYIEPEYAVASSILGGVNIASNLLVINEMGQPGGSKAAAYIGLVSGAATTTMGILNYDPYSFFTVHRAHRNLSMVNIGLGSATMVISTYSLLRKNDTEPRNTSWNLYSAPVTENEAALGLGFTKRF